MLTYREINYKEDVSQIVELLRTSLSENHTKENFLWKHYYNPFGRSYGRVACDHEKIVGVRMFMFWVFVKQEKKLKALRPVDTITHPDYRGKGIFKKLTLDGLRECSGRFDLVFNTPNKDSYPGYIKMGWKKYSENLYYRAALIIPFIQKKNACKFIHLHEIEDPYLTLDQRYYQTLKSSSYIQWRYGDFGYKAGIISIKGFELTIIYKLILIKGLKAIVVEEIFGNREHHTEALKTLAAKTKVFFIYYLKNDLTNFKFLLSHKLQQPIVVFREDQKNIIQEIRFTTGDLEGRI